jgi:phosphatidylglycerol lysyltransferase
VLVVAGLLSILASVNLWRRKRRALVLAVGLAAVSLALHVVDGPDALGVGAAAALLGLLAIGRQSYSVGSGAPDFRRAAVLALVALVVVLVYGSIGFWLVEPAAFGTNFHLLAAARQAILVASFAAGTELAPRTREALWLVESIRLLGATAFVAIGLSAFRPAVYRIVSQPRDLIHARAIVETHGQTAIDFFKLWPDKSYFFSPSGRSVVAYRVGNGVAIALGDPVGPSDEIAETIRAFVAMCRGNGWGVAFHQVGPELLPAYRLAGLRTLRIGDDAVVDLTAFTLEGGARRRLRSTLRKLEREGLEVGTYAPPIPDPILDEARRVSNAWLELPGRRERGFTLGHFDAAYLRSTPIDAVRDASGRMVAFVNRISSYRSGETTIDLMRHTPDAPAGTMDLLFVRLFERARDEGYTRFSLGMAPLAEFAPDEQASPEERAVQYLMSHLDAIFSSSGLRHFKGKFATAWEPRYLVYERLGSLPSVALALTAVSERGSRWYRR